MNPQPNEALRLPDDFPMTQNLAYERIGMIAHRTFMFLFWYVWFTFFLCSFAAVVAAHYGWTPPLQTDLRAIPT